MGSVGWDGNQRLLIVEASANLTPFRASVSSLVFFIRCRGISRQSAAHYVEMLCSKKRPDLFVSMNKQIIKNLSIGIYDGCKVAIELAAELAKP